MGYPGSLLYEAHHFFFIDINDLQQMESHLYPEKEGKKGKETHEKGFE